MKLNVFHFTVAAALCLGLASCSKSGSSPTPTPTKVTITGFTPSHGAPGDTITIAGTGFATGDSVYFGGIAAKTVIIVTTSQIKAIVPTGAASGSIQVKGAGSTATTSSSTNFTADATEAITGFSPTHGFTGDTVTITGKGFTIGDSIYFNGTVVTKIISLTATELKVVIPDTAAAGTGNIQVKLDGSTVSSASAFTIDPSVYVCGYEKSGAANSVAMYWKNGVAVSLTDGSHNAQASSIYVSGSDIYIAGYENNGTRNVAKYWKNGVAVILTDGSSDASTGNIVVSGNDVYVAGTIGSELTYWKNGTAMFTTNGFTYVPSVYVSGSDVYMSGMPTIAGYNNTAAYWKNGGTAVPLTNGIYMAEVNSIVVSGNNVYVGGAEYNGGNVVANGSDSVGNGVAKYWKNGVGVPISDGTGYADIISMYVSGNDVYAAGYDMPLTATSPNAVYWKNGTEVKLTDVGYGWGIYVFGSDVYVSGQSNINEDGISVVAAYWKNGTTVPLSGAGLATGIFVR
ncbi:MAG: IPT/TIG domain-containing protein [Chitinophagaceae bacterium]|jgi:hypothetical protein|nr:IPT/TIG domain-containing protein [Chitinophagaceae bacterium]